MLKNINISHKLVLMALLPIVGLIYFTSAITLDKLAIVKQMDLLQELSILTVKSSLLIHELQKERGMSAGFIGSKGNKFPQALQIQRKLTNIAVKQFKLFLNKFEANAFGDEITDNLKFIFASLEVIEIKRNSINNLALSLEEEMSYYTQIIDALLTNINHLSKVITDVKLYNKVVAYAKLLQAKEKAGLERATLNNVFSRDEGHFVPSMYSQFILLLSLQTVYIKDFFVYASFEQKKFYWQIIRGKAIEDVEKIRQLAIDKQLKRQLISDLQIQLGYGGLIHNFKNYVLRGKQKYIDAFHEQYQNVAVIMTKYQQLPDISPTDISNLEIVKKTFDKYNQYLSVALDLKSHHKTIDEVDIIVKIDDTPAIIALETLRDSSRLHQEPKIWWKMATDRIERFKHVEDHIADDLKLSAKRLKEDAQSVFLVSFVITGTTISLTLLLSTLFAHGITKPLQILINAANKISTGDRYGIYIAKDSKDEIGVLSGAMDQMLNSICDSEASLIQKNELIRKIFGRYLSDEVVDTLLETESGLSMGGERREITILTSDLRGFTAQSNKLPSEQVIKILNLYFEAMGEVIAKYNGTINDFMGDGILVFFGAPIVRDNDPERAVACAIAMQQEMEAVNKRIGEFDALEMGIGINTGEVVVGNIGSEKRTRYSAIGNNVNLAYRIESYTVGGQIFIPEATLEKIAGIVKISSERQVKPKGIKQIITLYEVDGIDGEYNLHLHKKDAELFSLWEDIFLQYTILEDKHVGTQVLNARVFKLSSTSALICCETTPLPEPLSNLKINFIDISDEDVYAKVLSQGSEKNSLFIHFTSLSVKVKTQLMDFCKTCDMEVL
jgi:class 3 adenylate cyclase